MYKIGLRSGAPVSVGHMMEVAGTVAYTDIAPGTLICIVEGMMENAPTGGCPDAVVSSVEMNRSGVPIRGTVMLLTPDMFLEAPVAGTDAQIAGLKNGNYIAFNDTGVDASATSAFCQIIDTLGAKKAGDKILVRFVKKEDNA